MKSVAIQGQLRENLGKSASRAIRSEGKALGVIYGSGKEIHFFAPVLAFRDIVYTQEFKTAEITIDGQTYKCILKDTQFDPITDQLIHLDFLVLEDNKKVIAELPIKLVGQSAGVKVGGRLEQRLKYLKVRTLPEHLVSFVEVDITELQLNGNIRVEDVKNEKYEFMNPARQPIASVVMTRALRQAESEASKGK